MKINPVTITLTTTDEVDALKYALENHIDMANDMLTDDIPYRPSEIREIAMMSDEGIKRRVKEIHDNVHRRFQQLEALQVILYQLKKALIGDVN